MGCRHESIYDDNDSHALLLWMPTFPLFAQSILVVIEQYPPYDYEENISRSFKMTSDDFVNRINAALERIEDNGMYQDIVKKYL